MKTRRALELNTSTMTVTLVEHTGTLTDGDFELVAKETYAIEDLPEELVKYCTLHGLAQKLTDHTAGKTDAAGYTSDSRFDLINELFDQLKEGNWKKPSTGGTSKVAPNAVIAKAIAAGMAEDQVELLKIALNVKS